MGNHTPLRSDALCLGVWAGFCVLIGAPQMRAMAPVGPDGVLPIGQAQQLPGGYVGVIRRRRILALIPRSFAGRLLVGVYDALREQRPFGRETSCICS